MTASPPPKYPLNQLLLEPRVLQLLATQNFRSNQAFQACRAASSLVSCPRAVVFAIYINKQSLHPEQILGNCPRKAASKFSSTPGPQHRKPRSKERAPISSPLPASPRCHLTLPPDWTITVPFGPTISRPLHLRSSCPHKQHSPPPLSTKRPFPPPI